eukprot:UN00218
MFQVSSTGSTHRGTLKIFQVSTHHTAHTTRNSQKFSRSPHTTEP